MANNPFLPLQIEVTNAEADYARLCGEVEGSLNKMLESTVALSEEHRTHTLQNLKNIRNSADLVVEMIQGFQEVQSNLVQIDQLAKRTAQLRALCEKIAEKRNISL